SQGSSNPTRSSFAPLRLCVRNVGIKRLTQRRRGAKLTRFPHFTQVACPSFDKRKQKMCTVTLSQNGDRHMAILIVWAGASPHLETEPCTVGSDCADSPGMPNLSN